MYAILSDGVLLVLCDRPRYVKVNEASGAYVEADEAEAIGISVRGDLYNINGGSAIPDAPEAVITQGEITEFVFRNKARIEENEEATGTAIIGIEDAVCELDETTDTRLSEVENALCELDEIISGGGEI